MTKTVDEWTSEQKQDLITDVISLVDKETSYDGSSVVQVILVGSYVWGAPTVDSDVDVLVEIPLRDYKIDDIYKTLMKDGKKITLNFRDRLKTPKIDWEYPSSEAYRQSWNLSKYSLTHDKKINGTDDEAFQQSRKGV
jgi:predicted nucleotidyltransferase